MIVTPGRVLALLVIPAAVTAGVAAAAAYDAAAFAYRLLREARTQLT